MNHFTLSSDIKQPAQRTHCVFGSVGDSRNEARVPVSPRDAQSLEAGRTQEAHLGFRAGHWKGQEAPEQDAAASSCGWQGELAGGST